MADQHGSLDFARYLAEIDRQTAALVDTARAADPAAAVPNCPGWTLHDLVGHLGNVQRWATTMTTLAPKDPRPDRAQPPADYPAAVDWLAEAGTLLTARLRECGPDQPCKVFGRIQPATTGFWARRQACEAAVHRLDAALAAGTEVATLADPEFAADGVDELLATMLPMRRRTDQVSGAVAYLATDTGDGWRVVLTPDAPLSVQRTGETADADVTVTGTADGLFRAGWGRPAPGVTVTGDPALLAPLAAP